MIMNEEIYLNTQIIIFFKLWISKLGEHILYKPLLYLLINIISMKI